MVIYEYKKTEFLRWPTFGANM